MNTFDHDGILSYLKTKIICLFIGHNFCGGVGGYGYDLKYCCRCTESRVFTFITVDTNFEDKYLCEFIDRDLEVEKYYNGK